MENILTSLGALPMFLLMFVVLYFVGMSVTVCVHDKGTCPQRTFFQIEQTVLIVVCVAIGIIQWVFGLEADGQQEAIPKRIGIEEVDGKDVASLYHGVDIVGEVDLLWIASFGRVSTVDRA